MRLGKSQLARWFLLTQRLQQVLVYHPRCCVDDQLLTCALSFVLVSGDDPLGAISSCSTCSEQRVFTSPIQHRNVLVTARRGVLHTPTGCGVHLCDLVVGDHSALFELANT